MRCVLIVLVITLLLAGCSGLPRAKELGEVAVMRTVGVDAGENGAVVTAVSDGAGDQNALELLSASGRSVAAAALGVQEQGERAVWLGHADRLVLGEGLARSGVESVMDYLAREPQLGPGVELWVAEGEAGAVLAAQGVTARLEQLSADPKRTVGCSAAALMSALARQGSVCVPALALADADDKGEDKMAIARGGYALLRQGKLVDWLRDERAAGYELLAGRGVGEIACVETGQAGEVSVLLEDSDLGVEPKFRDGELTGLEVRCLLRARVAQRDRVMTGEQLGELVLLYERLQAERLVAALELIQYWDADPAQLEQRAMLGAPARKEDIARQFKDRYRSLAIRVAVTARIEADGAVSE